MVSFWRQKLACNTHHLLCTVFIPSPFAVISFCTRALCCVAVCCIAVCCVAVASQRFALCLCYVTKIYYISTSFSRSHTRNHSIEKGAHHKRESSDKSKPGDEKGGGSSSSSGRRSSLNIFERLRLSKQDKIAADVQKKIRAVRAAEELDRKTSKSRSLQAREEPRNLPLGK